MRAAQAEFRNRRFRSKAHTSRFRRDERLEIHTIQKRGLKQLAFKNGAHDANDGFHRENNLTLAHSVDVHRKLQSLKVFKEVRLEELSAAGSIEPRQVFDIRFGEFEPIDHFRGLRHAARNGEAALERSIAEENREARLLVKLIIFPIPLRHSELIQVGKQPIRQARRPVFNGWLVEGFHLDAPFKKWDRSSFLSHFGLLLAVLALAALRFMRATTGTPMRRGFACLGPL